MIELIIAIVVAVVLWNLREAFYSLSSTFKKGIGIKSRAKEVELQDDYQELIDLVNEKKEAQDGKWHDMKDIDKLMTSSTKED